MKWMQETLNFAEQGKMVKQLVCSYSQINDKGRVVETRIDISLPTVSSLVYGINNGGNSDGNKGIYLLYGIVAKEEVTKAKSTNHLLFYSIVRRVEILGKMLE